MPALFIRASLTMLLAIQLMRCTTQERNTTTLPNKNDSLIVQVADSSNTSISRPDSVVFNTLLIPANAYHEQEVTLKKGITFKLRLLKTLNIAVAAEGLERPRFMALSPDGKLFLTDMHDRSDNSKGRVLVCEDWNNSTMKFEKITTYLNGLRNPNQVAFHNGYLYVAETQAVSRYKYEPGSKSAAAAPEIIARLPDYGLSYKYGGWHLTRSICFNNDKLYVSVGSSCNACIETDPVRASIIQMNTDGTDAVTFATGLRNSVGIKFLGNQLWVTSMGRDLMGADKPEDLFMQVRRGTHYGWPFYYQYRNKIYSDVAFKDSINNYHIVEPPVAYAGLAAHSAPLGFEFLKAFNDSLLRDAVLVCLHGSNTVARHRGNEIIKILGGNKYQPVVTGFLQGDTEKQRLGRPCDILMYDSHSFFFTDDTNGVLYYVYQ